MKALIFSGSTRQGSINSALVQAMTYELEQGGFDVTPISLSDYDMPIYNGDWEAENSVPEAAKKLAAQFLAHDVVYIVSPEYNGGLPALLKNTLDWLTRLGTMDHYHKPVFGIASCTPGPMSGIMVMRQMQFMLNRLGCELIPNQFGVGMASDAFDGNGHLARERDQGMAAKIVAALKSRVERKG